MIRHIVLFKFKDTTRQRTIDQIVNEFGKLPNKIGGIVDYQAGPNVSPEQLDKGFTHAFVVTFFDADARDDYLVHEQHLEFVNLLDGELDDVLVFDFSN